MAIHVAPLIRCERHRKCERFVVLQTEIEDARVCPPATVRVAKVVVLLLDKETKRRWRMVLWVEHFVLRFVALDSEGDGHTVRDRRCVERRLQVVYMPAGFRVRKLERPRSLDVSRRMEWHFSAVEDVPGLRIE